MQIDLGCTIASASTGMLDGSTMGICWEWEGERKSNVTLSSSGIHRLYFMSPALPAVKQVPGKSRVHRPSYTVHSVGELIDQAQIERWSTQEPGFRARCSTAPDLRGWADQCKEGLRM